MSQVRLLFSEAWSSIRMNLSTTFAATMTVLIGMCLLGLFLALGTWVLSWSNHVQKELQVHVYFQSDATPQQEAAVAARLRDDPRVKPGGVEFVSKAEALAQMKKNFKDLTRIPLPSSPLPDSILAKGPGGESDLKDPNASARLWGQLPAKQREQILQSQTEGFPPGYESILSSYYKRLAMENAESSAPATAAPPAGPSTRPAPQR